MKFLFPVRAISKSNEKIFNKYGRMFTSKKFKDFEETIRFSCKSQLPPRFEMYDKTVKLEVSITCYFKNDIRLDASNIPKSLTDALNKLVWTDDRQILALHTYIKYDSFERIEIEVNSI